MTRAGGGSGLTSFLEYGHFLSTKLGFQNFRGFAPWELKFFVGDPRVSPSVTVKSTSSFFIVLNNKRTPSSKPFNYLNKALLRLFPAT